MGLSLWEATATRPRFDSLRGHQTADAAVIGGGAAGLLCAYKLQEAGLHVILLEENVICGGVTAHTTAKLTWQHGLRYDQLIRGLGIEKARQYLLANKAALREYAALCASIDCDYEELPSYVYSLNGEKPIRDEGTALARLGEDVREEAPPGLPFPVDAALRVDGQAQFHPLRFFFALAKGLAIYEHSRVLRIKDQTAYTAEGSVTAKDIVIATHYSTLDPRGGYFAKVTQSRSYVLALEGARPVGGMAVDGEAGGLSFREAGGLLLFGGGGHGVGKGGGGFASLTSLAKRYYPGAVERYRYATQDCMTLDGAPYIGRFAKNTPNLLVATGFNKWGMTGSMVAATLLRDRILQRENRFAPAFEPARSLLHPQIIKNGLSYAAHLLTPTAPRCTHMGCALKWNAEEASWDCPCHGSRYDKEGKVLNTPAAKNLPKT